MGLLEVEIAIETISDDQEGHLQLAALPPGQVLSFLGQYFLSPQVFTILTRHIELDYGEHGGVQLTASSF
jgi:hypothetical protein